MNIIFVTLSNLITPGTGLFLLGRWQSAIFIQFSFYLSLVLLCWNRWIFEPVVIVSLFALTVGIYALSACLSIKYYNPSSHLSKANIGKACFFIGVCLLLFGAGFIYKHRWLGIHVYFVPSASMEPALKPGQFILVDTWAFDDKTPSLNSVVVFEHGIEKRHLVKRINHWPNGELTKNNLWYVMGDNRSFSQDSRYFGGIATSQLIGEVKLILVTISNKPQIQIDSLLTPVK